MKIAVIGGGAAGFFAAIACKTRQPDAEVVIWEKSNKLLAKVKVSGGGRCNVAHACHSITDLSKNYPRGEKFLKKAFTQFSTKETINWYESRGVKLKTEADNRMFPVTDSSQTIIDCLLDECRKRGVHIQKKAPVESIAKEGDGFILHIAGSSQRVDRVIVATGGSPKKESYDWLASLGHEPVLPVPSLFTFNMPGESVRSLMGVAVEWAEVLIQGTKIRTSGPLLITHWGMSGPAILKSSAIAARQLHAKDYQFAIQVNWVGGENENQLRARLEQDFDRFAKRKVVNKNPLGLPARLWEFLLQKIAMEEGKTWEQLSGKKYNQLVNALVNDTYQVSGKTTFKEEFVTCGGVPLSEVNVRSMESKICPGLFFAGEVLDIDGVTGGFNFQAAWTTGYIAGTHAVTADSV